MNVLFNLKNNPCRPQRTPPANCAGVQQASKLLQMLAVIARAMYSSATPVDSGHQGRQTFR